MKDNPKIAILYDWLDTNHGGAERVLISLLECFPDATLYSLFNNNPRWLTHKKIQTSWLQYMPKILRQRYLLSPLMPLAVESLDLSEFKIIISVSSSFIKGVITSPDQKHVCYMLTPTRFLYSHKNVYTNKILQIILSPVFKYWKRWDLIASSRPDIIIPISHLVKSRIKEYYHIDSKKPIYPCFTELTTKTTEQTGLKLPKKYWLVVSRYGKYKRIDQAILAAKQLNEHLVVVGQDNQKRLSHLANNKIHFYENLSDGQLGFVYKNAQALLMLGLEDFGIVGLEAIAKGVPVIINKRSGVAEILDKSNSVKIDPSSTNNIVEGMRKSKKLAISLSETSRKLNKYHKSEFKRKILEVIKDISS